MRIDELKDLADKQAALAAYGKQVKDHSIRPLAQRIQLPGWSYGWNCRRYNPIAILLTRSSLP